MINHLYLSGRCADDPKSREGKKSILLRIAVPRYEQGKGAVDEFFSVYVHGKTADIVLDQVRKGDRIFIQGYISPFKRDGAKYPENLIHANLVEFTPKPTAQAAVAEGDEEDGVTFNF